MSESFESRGESEDGFLLGLEPPGCRMGRCGLAAAPVAATAKPITAANGTATCGKDINLTPLESSSRPRDRFPHLGAEGERVAGIDRHLDDLQAPLRRGGKRRHELGGVLDQGVSSAGGS